MNEGDYLGHVLVVDDDDQALRIIRDVLEKSGYRVSTCGHPEMVGNMILQNDFDTVITDISMPRVSGFDVLKLARMRDEYMPVVMITGNTNEEYLLDAIKLGAYDFIKKPPRLSQIINTVKNAVNKKRLQVDNDNYRRSLEEMVAMRSEALKRANKRLEHNLVKTSLALVNALEASDHYTRGHSERVTRISMLIAGDLGLSEEQQKYLQLGSVLHDVGKIGVDPVILNKPDKLDPEEMRDIKRHPAIGYKILSPVEFDRELTDIVLQHHERPDGKGYPNGLAGEEISLLARIVAVADSYDAMTSTRPYRRAMSNDYGYREIMEHCGSQFDPAVVESFKRIYRSITDSDLDMMEKGV